MKNESKNFIGKALIISLVLIIIDLIGGFAHLKFESWFKWISIIVIIIAMIIVCIQYGKQETGVVTFGKVFGYGFKISLIVSILMGIYSLISVYLIFPEFVDQVLANTRATLESKGGVSDEQIDQTMAITKKFLQPLPILLLTFISTLFYFTIATLLGAAFTKKSEPDIFQDKA
jgi:uncharacterized membrane protein YciS (DUF1049 family)